MLLQGPLSNQYPWLWEEMRLAETDEVSFAGSTDSHLTDLSHVKILAMQLTGWALTYHTGEQLALSEKKWHQWPHHNQL